MMKGCVIIACPPYFVVMKLIYKYFNSYKPGVHFYGTLTNSIAPDVTPQNAASHLGLFCLHRENFIENLDRNSKSLLTPLEMKVDATS